MSEGKRIDELMSPSSIMVIQDNFSLSGRFRTLSKLVVIAVMLRGRHRGLPVAIDRAVLLPGELDDQGEWLIGYVLLDKRDRPDVPTTL